MPQPQRGADGGTDTGPRNVALDRQNPDLLAPPATDHGTLPNLWFPFSAAHNRLESAGWAREVTALELPSSPTLAGVNMRLNPGQTESGVRELHWHKQAEWAYMISGRARLTAIDQEGRTFADDVAQGDLWYFPAGLPHGIQAHAEGCEFLLVFDDGSFSENDTFLLTDWLAHTPRSVIAKNFGVPEELLKDLPTKEKYIFPAPLPAPLAEVNQPGPQGAVPQPFSYKLSAQAPQEATGGQVRIADSRNFLASTTIAAALVEVAPGGLRELHWHPNADEWQYYIEGQARMTVFASGGKARTFDYRAGDVGAVPFAMGHYIENTGNTTLRFLEVFKSDRFADVSLTQWLALTPPALVKAHLNVSDEFIAHLQKVKPVVVKAQS
ncbi:oxalate decarboxylase family bicupin [Hymenobacter sp. RP-2-7]|uniref:Oxalate decarboxylase family bicupin n=2 Tax=Hymenobacter polaris TaxID=2682546 RepID=A0A7Y0AFC6_9BACT|nr:oxalate decarboxylase family bicupin [Hymenobacter polaris]